MHYEIDEAKRTVAATEEGVAKVEELLGVENLYECVNTPLIHHLQNAIRAEELYLRDREYMVDDDGEVLIVDEFTGRTLHGRRYSEGLHQAIEAKEGVKIKEENQTLATITLQNYFRLYEKLAGMTGTAKTEESEFAPHLRHRGRAGADEPGRPVARTTRTRSTRPRSAKLDAVADDIADAPRGGSARPGRHGRRSRSPRSWRQCCLQLRGIPHEVLNAKNHFKEAEIVAQAGRIGAVTVATNMAGRGVDIMLGGNPEALATRAAEARKSPHDPETGEADEVSYQAAYDEALERSEAARCKDGGRQGPRPRRPVRAGHRAPRVAPHRQPAPWPLRPPGRPG